MRLLDLAAAGIIGMTSVVAIFGLNPHPYVASAGRYSAESTLWDALESFVTSHGLYWLQTSPPDEICSEMASASNSTITLGATIGSTSCGPPPVPGAASVHFHLSLPSRNLELSAWSGERA
jgi:hypothetical protein